MNSIKADLFCIFGFYEFIPPENIDIGSNICWLLLIDVCMCACFNAVASC